jgi:hypothetical protein
LPAAVARPRSSTRTSGASTATATATTAFQAASRSRKERANYRTYFDFNNDGWVDATDYAQFLARRNADGKNNARGYQLNGNGSIAAVS